MCLWDWSLFPSPTPGPGCRDLPGMLLAGAVAGSLAVLQTPAPAGGTPLCSHSLINYIPYWIHLRLLCCLSREISQGTGWLETSSC